MMKGGFYREIFLCKYTVNWLEKNKVEKENTK